MLRPAGVRLIGATAGGGVSLLGAWRGAWRPRVDEFEGGDPALNNPCRFGRVAVLMFLSCYFVKEVEYG